MKERRGHYKTAMNAAMLMAMTAMMTEEGGSMTDQAIDISKTEPREFHPWDHVQLTKAERKGKTFEEMQMLRKKKYEKEMP